MSDLESIHEDHGAAFADVGGRRVVERYRRPDRTRQAVRNGVGVREMPYGVITVEGDDRISYVDDVLTNRVPESDGEGCYALLLDPQGSIEADLYVYTTGDRVLLFTPPGRAASITEGWEVFIEDVEFTVATDSFAIFGVHGPQATEKVASVLTGASAPEEALSFVRGSIGDVGVTVVRTDAPTGEVGYEVICARASAVEVFDALLNHGRNAVPFGREVWNALTLEAGTPLFETELHGRIPNALGLDNAVDFEKGCYPGQEVVSRIENRGRPPERIVGLAPDALPQPSAAVFAGDTAVGEVTRAVESRDRGPIALAVVMYDVDGDLSVRVAGEEVSTAMVDLPFVEGSQQSARVPRYD